MDRNEFDLVSSAHGPERSTGAPAQKRSIAPDWESVLPVLQRPPPRRMSRPRELAYIINMPASRERLCVEVAGRTSPQALRNAQKKRRSVPLFRLLQANQALIDEQTDPADIAALTALLGASSSSSSFAFGIAPTGGSCFWLSRAARDLIMPLLGRTGRCRLRRSSDELEPALLRWDDGEPWQFRLKVRVEASRPSGDDWELTGVLRRGETEIPLAQAELLFEGGLMFLGETITRCDDGGAWSWIGLLRRYARFHISEGHQRAFLEEVYALPRLPPLDLPEGRALLEVAPTPIPHIHVFPSSPSHPGEIRPRGAILATFGMEYDRFLVPVQKPGCIAFDSERHRLIRRDPEAEEAAKARLDSLSWKPVAPSAVSSAGGQSADLQIPVKHFARAVHALVTEGWNVEASGKLYRRPTAFQLSLSSGIDWFDLRGTCNFEGASVSLPAVLAALRRGDSSVVLDDGSLGLLPEEWLSRYGMLTELGRVQDEQIRFKRSQIGLLDALLAAQPHVNVDAVFEKARAELRRFSAITPSDAPASFQGELRPYQRDGLGWLKFLQRFGFGGCLADDMGLGKTVQVLALLASRKAEAPSAGPSLVVAPRSLIFNWKSEAARFTPALRVLDHTGAARMSPGEHFEGFDLVLTTYGTLRRDALPLSKVRFDYLILDEAQAIKNNRSEAAKAARLQNGQHRLALSGTPVENHLGELWSLFEFLNPGMLGRASVFQGAAAAGQDLDPRLLALLARALGPFLLRRTKAEVAKDLPERVEATLLCELEPKQRALYDELRRFYQVSLKQRVLERGIERSKIHVLEALLRLRQVACHPGLVDPKRRGDGSAKLDALFGELSGLLENGHKILVFSQFTSLLSIVRQRLDDARIPYEYLDGDTGDRGARVDRFQTDPRCPVFLVSLKAGGLGLNLTAAEYVFLLDPWWNPATEAQAIDRAHRIGQTRAVFAYRLIAKDTIEERIVELSQKKRKLAESVINGDNHLLRDLSAEDLELLLS